MGRRSRDTAKVNASLSEVAPALVFVLLLASCDAEPDIAAHRREMASPSGGSNSGGATSDVSPPPEGLGGAEAEPSPLVLSGDLQAHDPEIVVTAAGYHLFFTGDFISTKTSSDLLDFRAGRQVFDEMPSSIRARLDRVTDLWAPDVSFFGGAFHLYFAASTFGTGVSCIGHATAPEIAFPTTWTDEGEVICSDVDEIVDWDAIDPSTFFDENGDVWMVFGSYGSGIKLIRLDATGRRSGTSLYALAARPVEEAIQAPSMLYHEGFYYLFASFDQCCAGVNSTSNIRVGRAEDVSGPFIDREGVPLIEGGGSPFITGNQEFRGVGGSSVFDVRGRLFIAYHAYDASLAGQATLRIAPLSFDDEAWPISHDP